MAYQEEATRQSDNVTPAEFTKVLVVAVDATSRVYDLSLVALGATFDRLGHLYVKFTADGGNVYYSLGTNASPTVDNTAALSVGSTVNGFTTNGAGIFVNLIPEHVRLDRSAHRYLCIKTSTGTANLRIHASSQPSVTTLAGG